MVEKYKLKIFENRIQPLGDNNNWRVFATQLPSHPTSPQLNVSFAKRSYEFANILLILYRRDKNISDVGLSHSQH